MKSVSYAACHCKYSCLPQFHLSAERSGPAEMRCLSPVRASVPVCRCACNCVPPPARQWSVGAGTPGGTHHTPHTATLHLHLHLHLHLTQGAATMVRSLGWLLAALANLGPGVAANQRDSEVVIQRHFKGDIYTTSK